VWQSVVLGARHLRNDPESCNYRIVSAATAALNSALALARAEAGQSNPTVGRTCVVPIVREINPDADKASAAAAAGRT